MLLFSLSFSVRAHSAMSSEEEPPVRVRSREGVEVYTCSKLYITCSREAARRAGTQHAQRLVWMDDTAAERWERPSAFGSRHVEVARM